ncbi:MAG: CoB--CoM heterodisulfide reductase subunit B [Candidatus Nezhaarchaeota archaeon]|nr:CoB--CoM heterodisulfide reductase subunit B [Candidatus Nezhaarchaeota archaeon]MCX8141265.1 CoB--CoM heterodisulfide reductase subunit B [Candidatus Nezhaarchaeota archaeon]MDW8049531.1 CoB--CoM heterodisulfide reductase subunit B [Nitrososphaerota archaeon]
MSTLRYAFFLGCIMPNRYPGLESSIRRVFKELGIELVDMKGASCCPAPGVARSFSFDAWLTLAARNLSIAEEMGLDVVTGCNGCYATLREVSHEYHAKERIREKVNSYLSQIGRSFNGKIQAKHVLEVLYFDIGVENLKKFIKKQLNLRAVVHYGCHLIKPSNKRPWMESVERPRFFDELVEVTGAKSVDVKDKYMCCGAGGGVRSGVIDVALDITREKIENAYASKADCIVNACSFCHLQFDLGQVEINKARNTSYSMPIIYYTQLLGLAMGFSPKELGLHQNFISVEPLLKKIGTA